MLWISAAVENGELQIKKCMVISLHDGTNSKVFWTKR